jgi:hypothetical protein
MRILLLQGAFDCLGRYQMSKLVEVRQSQDSRARNIPEVAPRLNWESNLPMVIMKIP